MGLSEAQEAKVQVIINGTQALGTIKDIEQAMRTLKAASKNMSNPEDIKKVTEEHARLRKQIVDHNNALNGTTGIWSKLSKEVKAYGMIAVSYLGIQALTSSIQSIISKNSELSDSLADIQQTTGMSANEVKNFNKELTKVNTRTATKELRDIAIAAGQLGVAKSDIKDFTIATDKLNVALGREFGGNAEELTTVLGKMRNVLSDIKSDNISEDMLHIGNALLELGQSGLATAPVVADFANRISGVGIPLGLTSAQVLGLSATLQELNVSTERGGTAITKILQKMSTETENFAKIAGLSIKDYTDLVNNDLYGAFKKVIEGSQKAGSSSTALAAVMKDAELQGSGASEVFLKLSKNMGLLDEKTKLSNDSLKSTDTIMESFNRKNNNFAANWDRLVKSLSAKFVNSGMVNMLQSIVGAMADWTKINPSQEMEKERLSLLGIEFKLRDVNTKQSERIKIINELKDKYPDYLKNIDADKVSNDELSKALSKVNEMLINKIIIQRQQEKIEEIAQKAADYREQRLDAEIRMLSKIAAATEKYHLKKRDGLTLEQQANDIMSQMANKDYENGYRKEAVLTAIGRAQRGIKDELIDYTAALKQENSLTSEFNKLGKEKQMLINYFGMNEAKSSTPNKNEGITDHNDETGKSPVLEKEKDQTEKLLKEIRSMRIAAIEDELQRELAKLEMQWDLDKQDVNNTVASQKVKSELLLEIDKTYFDAREKLKAKMTDEASEKDLKNNLDAIDQWHAQEKLKLSQQYADGSISEQQYQDGLVDIQKQRLTMRMINLQDYGKDTTADAQAMADLLIGIEKKKNDQLDKLSAERFKDLDERLRSMSNKEIKKELEQEQMALVNMMLTGVSITGESVEQMIEHIQKLLDKLSENTSKFWEKFGQDVAQYGGMIAQAWGSILRIQSNNTNAFLQKQNSAYEKDKVYFGELLKRKVLTQEQYDKKMQDLEAKHEKEQRRAAHDEAVRNKRLAIFNAGINTAQAVAGALAVMPWSPHNLLMASLVGILGGLQIAEITSDPVPELGKGKRFTGIGKHPVSKQRVMDPSGNIFYVEEDETLLSAATRYNNPELVDALLDASLNNDGRIRGNFGIAALDQELPELNTSRISETSQYIKSGFSMPFLPLEGKQAVNHSVEQSSSRSGKHNDLGNVELREVLSNLHEVLHDLRTNGIEAEARIDPFKWKRDMAQHETIISGKKS